MATFEKSLAPSTWGVERGKLDNNWDIAQQFELVASLNYMSDQAPTGLDDAGVVSVKFGSGTLNATYITGDGGDNEELTFTAAAVNRRFEGRFRFQPYKPTAQAESHLVSWAEVSTDGGSNWAATGDSAIFVLNNASTSIAVYIPFVFTPPVAGFKFRSRLARASTNFGSGAGNNSGELRSLNVSTELTDAPVAPSAAVVVNLINENGSKGGMQF